MILTAGGLKGGSGKSTLATNLAVLHSQRGLKVTLLDADEQATSSYFTSKRAERLGSAGYTCTKASGRAVFDAARGFSQVYDTVIIDTGGRDSASQRAALLASDVAMFPFVPRAFDLWTIDDLAALVAEVRQVNPGLAALTYLSRADYRGQMITAARELLDAGTERGLLHSNLRLSNLIAYAAASAEGLAVTEHRPRDAKAADEMEALYSFAVDTYIRTQEKTPDDNR